MLRQTDPKEKHIDQFLKEYDEESYVWISYRYFLDYQDKDSDEEENPKESFLRFLVTHQDLNSIKDYIKKNLHKENMADIKNFTQHCMDKKLTYTSSNHLLNIKTDARYNWYAINEFINLQKIRYNYELYKLFNNPYLFILYLIYIEDIENKNYIIKDLEYISAHLIKIKSFKININKYINDRNFQEWAYSYIERKFRPRSYPNFTPHSNEDYKNYIFGYFDSIYTTNINRYENEVNKLKKAWQQKVFRDKGNTKSLHHLPLTKRTKNELKKLAEFANKTETDLLSDLIHETYLKEMCDENGKSLY